MAALARWIRDPVDPHIDHDRAFLHHFRLYELRLSDRHDQQIGLPRDRPEIAGTAVRQRYRAIARIAVAAHQDAHRTANDVAAAHHHAMHSAGAHTFVP